MTVAAPRRKRRLSRRGDRRSGHTNCGGRSHGRPLPLGQDLAPWARLCPGNHESAGKRLSGKIRKGNAPLRRGLVQAAHAAGRSRSTYLGALYRRLAARRGRKRAAVAVVHTILVIAYQLFANKSTYADLGPDFFECRKPDDTEEQLIRKLERLGDNVTLEKVA